MAPPEVQVGTREEIVSALARDVASEAARATAARGFFAVAVPGGSVATTCFSALAALPLDWTRVHCFWVDERSVPPSDADSNYALARLYWLAPASVPAASIHRMPADLPDLGRAAAEYSTELVRVLGPAPTLDYALVGVGPDGHVASLFPRHEAIACEDRTVTGVLNAPKPPPRRLTLTLPTLARAGRLAVVAFGDEKAQAIHEALEDDESMLPLALLLRRARRPLVLIDHAAASLTRPPA